MREYGKVIPTVTLTGKLQFRIPKHAAFRAAIYARDHFTCKQCGAMPTFVPLGYDGRFTLDTTRRSKSGHAAALVLDHIVSRRNGGTNDPSNLQTLCDSCNAAKSGLVDAIRRAHGANPHH
jgi:5-methylcytosine-specific restriction endonuclease McrA